MLPNNYFSSVTEAFDLQANNMRPPSKSIPTQSLFDLPNSELLEIPGGEWVIVGKIWNVTFALSAVIGLLAFLLAIFRFGKEAIIGVLG